ncbi:MAG: hypothetical protein L0Z50_34355 [Verrucomicrobiales bacterium]|nr:hypothetical protein [Verrucomicrobiales bacterium]
MKTVTSLIWIALATAAFGQASITLPWVTPAVRAPRVEFRTFESAAAKTKVSYHLYTPAIYDTKQEQRFPVLYWLHGTGGGAAGVRPLASHFDSAIGAGKIPPMIVVFANGLASSMWCDSKDGNVPMETVVVQELVPHMDATFRTIARREGRLIEGFSMGGYGAARLGFKYPESSARSPSSPAARWTWSSKGRAPPPAPKNASGFCAPSSAATWSISRLKARGCSRNKTPPPCSARRVCVSPSATVTSRCR